MTDTPAAPTMGAHLCPYCHTEHVPARSTPAEALDPQRLGGLIERAIRESRRKNGLLPDGWTLVEMALAYSPETPTEPSRSPHNREANHE